MCDMGALQGRNRTVPRLQATTHTNTLVYVLVAGSNHVFNIMFIDQIDAVNSGFMKVIAARIKYGFFFF